MRLTETLPSYLVVNNEKACTPFRFVQSPVSGLSMLSNGSSRPEPHDRDRPSPHSWAVRVDEYEVVAAVMWYETELTG